MFYRLITAKSDINELQQVLAFVPEETNFDRNSKVLLVEDNKINQAVMLAVFESFNFTFTQYLNW